MCVCVSLVGFFCLGIWLPWLPSCWRCQLGNGRRETAALISLSRININWPHGGSPVLRLKAKSTLERSFSWYCSVPCWYTSISTSILSSAMFLQSATTPTFTTQTPSKTQRHFLFTDLLAAWPPNHWCCFYMFACVCCVCPFAGVSLTCCCVCVCVYACVILSCDSLSLRVPQNS